MKEYPVIWKYELRECSDVGTQTHVFEKEKPISICTIQGKRGVERTGSYSVPLEYISDDTKAIRVCPFCLIWLGGYFLGAISGYERGHRESWQDMMDEHNHHG